MDDWRLTWQYATPAEQYNMMEDNSMTMRIMPNWDFSPYEQAGFPQKETYLWDCLSVHEVVEDICGLERGDLEKDVATMIYDNLEERKVHQFVERWFDEQDEEKYNRWWEDRYSWPEI